MHPFSWLFLTILYMTGIVYCSLRPAHAFHFWFLNADILNFLHIPAYAGLEFFLFFTLRNFLISLTGGHLPQTCKQIVFDTPQLTIIAYKFLFLSFLIAVLFGVLNEFIQAHVPGRDFSVADMVRNAFGAGLMAAGIWKWERLKWKAFSTFNP